MWSLRLGVRFKSLASNIGKITKRIRIANWGILVICFFLPFTRGCFSLIETPYKDAFKSFDYFLIEGLPFLYPLLLLLGLYIFYLIRNKQRKNSAAKILYFICFYIVTFSVIFVVNSRYNEYLRYGYIDSFNTSVAIFFVILWGIMGFGCERLSTKNILTMITFQFSTIAGGWIAFAFFLAGERLIGAWLSVIASVSIFVTYVFDYLNGLYRSVHLKQPVDTNE